MYLQNFPTQLQLTFHYRRVLLMLTLRFSHRINFSARMVVVIWFWSRRMTQVIILFDPIILFEWNKKLFINTLACKLDAVRHWCNESTLWIDQDSLIFFVCEPRLWKLFEPVPTSWCVHFFGAKLELLPAKPAKICVLNIFTKKILINPLEIDYHIIYKH